MRALGILIGVSGWLIVIAAIIVLHDDAVRLIFAFAGIVVQLLGLALLTWAYRLVVKQSSAT